MAEAAVPALAGLGFTLALSLLLWLASLALRDVSIVDRFWSLLIAGSALCFWWTAPVPGPRAVPALLLLAVWALRLAWHVTRRNWGHGEDRRYQAIRARNQPGFALKSVYLVFGLQAVLAWAVSLPLLAAVRGGTPPGLLFGMGLGLAAFGIVFEAVADWQLARFLRDAASRGRVMDRGVWGWSRHPNYFGECCTWWGLFLVGLDAGGWWAVVSPLFMTVTLLKVSGVNLLEQDMAQRRPGYADYMRRVSAFIPRPPRAPGA